MKSVNTVFINIAGTERQWQLMTPASLCIGSAFNYIKPEHDRTQASLAYGDKQVI